MGSKTPEAEVRGAAVAVDELLELELEGAEIELLELELLELEARGALELLDAELLELELLEAEVVEAELLELLVDVDGTFVLAAKLLDAEVEGALQLERSLCTLSTPSDGDLTSKLRKNFRSYGPWLSFWDCSCSSFCSQS